MRVAWYSLGAADEAAFERYRKLLRALRREGLAAIYDLVARPGAHYVAWHMPPMEHTSPTEDEAAAIAAVLGAHGWSLDDAYLCADGERHKVYALAFERSEAPHQPVTESPRTLQPVVTTPREQRRSEGWTKRIWAALWLRPWLPGVALALTGTLLLASSLYYPPSRDFVVVPNMRGQEVSEALSVLRGLGLSTSSSPVSSTENVGQVLSSEPGAGAQLRPGRTVHLRYALPPGQLAPTDVPELSGLSVREAERQLLAAGLELGTLSRLHSGEPSGAVIAQSWEGRAPTGSSVDLLVSEGSRGALTFLPDLTGMNLGDAAALVRAAGLAAPEIERVNSTGQRANVVLGQNIAPNQLIAQDAAALRLTVTGETPRNVADETGVPNFTGMTLEGARRLAQREGLRLATPNEISSGNLPTGVVTQNPPPGTVLAGQRVTLTLNEPPRSVPTPDAAAEVRPGEPRRAAYRWDIQEGISESVARVTVTTLSGEPELIAAQRIRGGERIEGTWQTSAPGPVTFELTLDGLRYGERITVTP